MCAGRKQGADLLEVLVVDVEPLPARQRALAQLLAELHGPRRRYARPPRPFVVSGEDNKATSNLCFDGELVAFQLVGGFGFALV